jgi:hypothetical protein
MIRSHRGVTIPTHNAPRPFLRAMTGLVLLLALALPAAAQEEPPRFLLERIVVEGLRRAGSDRLVVAESLLREGSAYSEDDLRQAVFRIKRLPFILDAEFALRKGSERGRYELVIGVEEVKPYFLQLSTDVDLRENRFDRFEDRVTDTGIVGLRYFVNPHDLAYAAWNPDGLVNLGYTRFNLFGRGGYASLQSSFRQSDSDVDVSLVVAVPLVGNHALRSTSSWNETDFSHGWQQGVEWLYNTTDDPLLPTEGVEASARVAYGDGRLEFRESSTGPTETQRRRADELSLNGRKVWAWTSRQSVSVGGNAFLSRNREDHAQHGLPAGTLRKFYGAGVDVGYAWSVWRTQGIGVRRDLRLEVGTSYIDERADPAFIVDRSRAWGANLGIVFRNAWSLIRLTFHYFRQVGDGH